MAEEAVWGIGIIVRWLLIIAVLLLTIWAIYNFLLKPVMETFGKESIIPIASIFLSTKSFKRVKI